MEESFGLSIAESLIADTPVICMNIGGFSDLVHDKINGIFIEKDLGESIDKFRQLSFDNNPISNSVKDKLILKNCASQHVDLYKSILNA